MSFHTVLHSSVVFLILSQILYCVVMMWYQCVAICCLLCSTWPHAVRAGALHPVPVPPFSLPLLRRDNLIFTQLQHNL